MAQSLPNIKTDWSRWNFFFCDERVVPFDSNDSTYGEYKSNLIGKIPISEDQFIKINPDLSGKIMFQSKIQFFNFFFYKISFILIAEDAAKDYIKKMSVFFPPDRVPCFDVLLLGLGPDGHICSLFPGHKLLNEASLWVCPINDSPKPPPSRITLTLPVINNAKKCIFAVTGSSKAEIIKVIILLKIH